MYNPYDFYFKQAKKGGYKARSIFKLEEIDKRYHLFDKNIKYVLDIGCFPGSWTQYAYKRVNDFGTKGYKIIGFDIQDASLNLDGVHTYHQDITEYDTVEEIIKSHGIEKFDMIISDMAPNTTGIKDIDAMKSIMLLESTIPIYEKFLKDDGKFAIKIFMGPGFDNYLKKMKNIFGGKRMKSFKPQATRKESKEIYLLRY